jgi:hypothetical protein
VASSVDSTLPDLRPRIVTNRPFAAGSGRTRPLTAAERVGASLPFGTLTPARLVTNIRSAASAVSLRTHLGVRTMRFARTAAVAIAPILLAGCSAASTPSVGISATSCAPELDATECRNIVSAAVSAYDGPVLNLPDDVAVDEWESCRLRAVEALSSGAAADGVTCYGIVTVANAGGRLVSGGVYDGGTMVNMESVVWVDAAGKLHAVTTTDPQATRVASGDLDPLVVSLLTALGVILAVSVPLALIGGLLWVARRRLSGRRSRLDGLFTGAARANAMNSHLQAATPDPDALAHPLPARGPNAERRRRRSRRP